LEMHPNDYDAHLGLALALRGQIDDSNYDKQVAAVQAELDACKKIDPARPDSYFNEGILTQEYKAKGAGALEKTLAVYDQAKLVFRDFMDKAAGKSEYDGAVKKAKERLQDIDDTETFLKAGPAPSSGPPSAPDSGVPGDTSDGGSPSTTAAGDGGVPEAGAAGTSPSAALTAPSDAAAGDASGPKK
jgi:hypothetical protein